MAKQITCAVFVQGMRVETAPGIWVGKASGACHREADFWAYWTDQRPATEDDIGRDHVPVPQRTPICGVHKIRLERGIDPLVDSRGVVVDVTFTTLDQKDDHDGIEGPDRPDADPAGGGQLQG